jgi:hypothetical protein
MRRIFPVFDWGQGYDATTFSKDALAAVVVTIMLIPQGMAYAMLDDSKSPNMANGFTVLRDGYAEVFGPDGFTDWRGALDAGVRLKVA